MKRFAVDEEFERETVKALNIITCVWMIDSTSEERGMKSVSETKRRLVNDMYPTHDRESYHRMTHLNALVKAGSG